MQGGRSCLDDSPGVNLAVCGGCLLGDSSGGEIVTCTNLNVVWISLAICYRLTGSLRVRQAGDSATRRIGGGSDGVSTKGRRKRPCR